MIYESKKSITKRNLKERSEENEIIVSELQDTVEYHCGLYEEQGELKGRALQSLKNAVERLEVFNAIGSIYQWGVEVLNKCGIKYKGIKESKKLNKKTLKESTKWVSDVADKLMISFEDILNIFEEYGYGKEEAKDFYDSKWNDVTDAFNEMAELAVLFGLEDWTESKKSARKSLKEKLNDNGDVKFNDVYSCDLVNVLEVTVYDKELYEKLREEDLVLYQKGLYEQIDWKSFQDEISYLRDDIYASDDFDVKFTLSNGILIIDILDDTDKDIIMEYRLESKFVN